MAHSSVMSIRLPLNWALDHKITIHLYCAQYVHIINLMKYEWDKSKAKINLRKHGVDFADAVISLEDENALTIEDFDQNEQVFKTLGMGL